MRNCNSCVFYERGWVYKNEGFVLRLVAALVQEINGTINI